jgi:hypothetical protein
MSTVALARGDTRHSAIIAGDGGRSMPAAGFAPLILNSEGYLEEALRRITHPSFPQEDGMGIFTYLSNPDITRNFVYQPVAKVDAAVQRTLTSSVLIQQPQLDEDVVVTEIWTGESKASTLAEMARTFHEFWRTLPDVGENLTWEPLDISEDSYGVQIVNVQVGTQQDWEYREIRDDITTREGAYLANTLMVQYKIVRETKPPKGVISLVGA